MDLGPKLGAKLEPSWHPNRRKMKANFESPVFEKILFFQRGVNDFLPSRDRKIHGKWIQKLFKIEAQDGRHLGIDFWWIWVGFGRQVGTENRAKMEEKLHRKYDAKQEPPRRRLGTVLVAFWPPKIIFW